MGLTSQVHVSTAIEFYYSQRREERRHLLLHRCCPEKAAQTCSCVTAEVCFLPTSTSALRLAATPAVLCLVRVPDLAVLLSTLHPHTPPFFLWMGAPREVYGLLPGPSNARTG